MTTLKTTVPIPALSLGQSVIISDDPSYSYRIPGTQIVSTNIINTILSGPARTSVSVIDGKPFSTPASDAPTLYTQAQLDAAVMAASNTALTAPALAALWATLPTSPPSTPGLPWRNGDTLSFS